MPDPERPYIVTKGVDLLKKVAETNGIKADPEEYLKRSNGNYSDAMDIMLDENGYEPYDSDTKKQIHDKEQLPILSSDYILKNRLSDAEQKDLETKSNEIFDKLQKGYGTETFGYEKVQNFKYDEKDKVRLKAELNTINERLRKDSDLRDLLPNVIKPEENVLGQKSYKKLKNEANKEIDSFTPASGLSYRDYSPTDQKILLEDQKREKAQKNLQEKIELDKEYLSDPVVVTANTAAVTAKALGNKEKEGLYASKKILNDQAAKLNRQYDMALEKFRAEPTDENGARVDYIGAHIDAQAKEIAKGDKIANAVSIYARKKAKEVEAKAEVQGTVANIGTYLGNVGLSVRDRIANGLDDIISGKDDTLEEHQAKNLERGIAEADRMQQSRLRGGFRERYVEVDGQKLVVDNDGEVLYGVDDKFRPTDKDISKFIAKYEVNPDAYGQKADYSPTRLIGTSLQVMADMVPIIAANAAIGVASAALPGGQAKTLQALGSIGASAVTMFSDNLKRNLELGKGYNYAWNTAMGTTLVQALIEQAGGLEARAGRALGETAKTAMRTKLDDLVQSYAGRSLAKTDLVKKAKGVIKEYIGEGIEESGQDITSQVSDHMFYGVDVNIDWNDQFNTWASLPIGVGGVKAIVGHLQNRADRDMMRRGYNAAQSSTNGFNEVLDSQVADKSITEKEASIKREVLSESKADYDAINDNYDHITEKGKNKLVSLMADRDMNRMMAKYIEIGPGKETYAKKAEELDKKFRDLWKELDEKGRKDKERGHGDVRGINFDVETIKDEDNERQESGDVNGDTQGTGASEEVKAEGENKGTESQAGGTNNADSGGNAEGTVPILTKEAEDILSDPTKVPVFISKNLERIAKENGIEITGSMTGADVINALKQKRDGKATNESSGVQREATTEDGAGQPGVSDVDPAGTKQEAVQETVPSGEQLQVLAKDNEDKLVITDKLVDVKDDVTDEKTGEKTVKEFKITFSDGARSYGNIKGDVANIVGIEAAKKEGSIDPKRGTKVFDRLIGKLKENGIKTIRISNQSKDSRVALGKLVEKGILGNPRDNIGISVDEHPSTFDIQETVPSGNKMSVLESTARKIISNQELTAEEKQERANNPKEVDRKVNSLRPIIEIQDRINKVDDDIEDLKFKSSHDPSTPYEDSEGNQGTIKIDDGGKAEFVYKGGVKELGNVSGGISENMRRAGIVAKGKVQPQGDNKYAIDGVFYKNNLSDPARAVEVDEEGNISVELDEVQGGYGNAKPVTKSRKFTGPQAEELAYQIHLEKISKDEKGFVEHVRQGGDGSVPAKAQEGAAKNNDGLREEGKDKQGDIFEPLQAQGEAAKSDGERQVVIDQIEVVIEDATPILSEEDKEWLEEQGVDPKELEKGKDAVEKDVANENAKVKGASVSGLTPEEQQKAIAKRDKETSFTPKEKAMQELWTIVDKYHAMAEGARGKSGTAGQKLWGDIMDKGRSIGVDVSRTKGAGKTHVVIKDKGKRVKNVKNFKEGNYKALTPNRDKGLLANRSQEVKDIFQKLWEDGTSHSIQVEYGVQLSDVQKEVAFDDVADGIPSNGAEAVLDVIEGFVNNGNIVIFDKGAGEMNIPINQFFNAQLQADNSEVATAKKVLDAANKRLREAERRMAEANGVQASAFNAPQGSLFGVKGEDIKTVIDPLKKAVKEAREAYEKAVAKAEAEENAKNGQQSLFQKEKRKLQPIDTVLFNKLLEKLNKAIPGVFGAVLNGTAFEEKLKEMHGISMRDKKGIIYGFVGSDGKVYLNGDHINANTPIHEYGHLVINMMKTKFPQVYRRGLNLADKSPYLSTLLSQGKNSPYASLIDRYKKGDKAPLQEEALAMAIGDMGERMVQRNMKNAFLEWVDKMWTSLKRVFGGKLTDMTPEQLNKLTFKQFATMVAGQLVSGDAVEGEMLAPNGKPSNLNPEQYRLVRTPEFIAFFGDWINDPKNASKVVDENGEPLVVYHGTPTGGFTEFKEKGKRDSGFLGKAFYFTKDLQNAEAFTSRRESDGIVKKRQVYATFLNVKNPLDVKDVDADKLISMLEVYRKNKGLSPLSDKIKADITEDFNGTYSATYSEKILKDNSDPSQLAEGNGYDGILGAREKAIAVFSPNQIKLADGGNTSFNTGSNDIRFQVVGEKAAKTLDKAGSGVGGDMELNNLKTVDGYTFELDKDNSIDNEKVFKINDGDGNNLGKIYIVDRDGAYHIENVRLNKERTGVGYDIYKKLIATLDKPIKSGEVQNKKSKGLWDKLVKEGLAKKEGDGYVSIEQSLKATPKSPANVVLAAKKLDNLDIAKNMEANGADAITIFHSTGWQKGGDGKWRTEISDIFFNNLFDGDNPIAMQIEDNGSVKLGDLVSGEVFDAYPKLKDLPVKFVPGTPGNGQYDGNEIKLQYKNDMDFITNERVLLKALAHEIQHYIQDEEGFARGTTSDYFTEDKVNYMTQIVYEDFIFRGLEYDEYIKQHGNAAESLLEPIDEWKEFQKEAKKGKENVTKILADAKRHSVSKYRKVAGEVEANNVMTRMDMPLSERLVKTFTDTEDVAEDEKIYLFDSRVSNAVFDIKKAKAEKNRERAEDNVNMAKAKLFNAWNNLKTVGVVSDPWRNAENMKKVIDAAIELAIQVGARTKDEIRAALNDVIKKHNLSPNQLNNIARAVKAYYEPLDKDIFNDLAQNTDDAHEAFGFLRLMRRNTKDPIKYGKVLKLEDELTKRQIEYEESQQVPEGTENNTKSEILKSFGEALNSYKMPLNQPKDVAITGAYNPLIDNEVFGTTMQASMLHAKGFVQNWFDLFKSRDISTKAFFQEVADYLAANPGSIYSEPIANASYRLLAELKRGYKNDKYWDSIYDIMNIPEQAQRRSNLGIALALGTKESSEHAFSGNLEAIEQFKAGLNENLTDEELDENNHEEIKMLGAEIHEEESNRRPIPPPGYLQRKARRAYKEVEQNVINRVKEKIKGCK